MESKRIIALIPARGGSKGIPRKNLALLGGIPLILHTIRASLGSTLVTETWVSSDDQNILQLAQDNGAFTLKRPQELSLDSSKAESVVNHFLDTLPQDIYNKNPIILYLQPTSPLRSATHIDLALTTMIDSNAQSLTSVCLLEKSPFKSFTIDDSGKLRAVFSVKMATSSRQCLPPCYITNGAIYAFHVFHYKHHGGFPLNGSIPFIMGPSESIDIDDMLDLKKAENYYFLKCNG